MAKQDQTASFLLRFTQNIFQDDQGESNVQWRGKITHVQGNDSQSFSEIKDAMTFIQEKLSAMTLSAIKEDVSQEEKEGILNKSMDIWKKLAKSYPKMVVEAIKDPKAQVTQIQEQLSSKAEEISQRLDLDSYRPSLKSDVQGISSQLAELTSIVTKLQKKMDKLDKKISKA